MKSPSNVVFTGDFNFGEVTVNMNFNSVEANAIQNGISREKLSLKESGSNPESQVLFYWDSAKYDEKSKSIDRGFVDSISQSSLKVIFKSQDIKKQMLDMNDNPFHFLFIVDLEVMTVQGQPTVYKILELRDVLPK